MTILKQRASTSATRSQIVQTLDICVDHLQARGFMMSNQWDKLLYYDIKQILCCHLNLISVGKCYQQCVGLQEKYYRADVASVRTKAGDFRSNWNPTFAQSRSLTHLKSSSFFTSASVVPPELIKACIRTFAACNKMYYVTTKAGKEAVHHSWEQFCLPTSWNHQSCKYDLPWIFCTCNSLHCHKTVIFYLTNGILRTDCYA